MQRATILAFHNANKLLLPNSGGAALFGYRTTRQLIQQIVRKRSSASTNRSAVLIKNKEIICEDRQVPQPEPDELLIKVQMVGVCGTDIHFWKTGSIGPLVIDKPFVLGHEAAGIVAGMGAQVKGFKVGDRVTIEPGVPCRHCAMCRKGHYNICSQIRYLGVPPKDGSFAQYVTHAADFCFKMPDSMTMEEGALLEPLSVSLYACREAGVTAASKVLVTGAGPIGLLAALGSQAYGATRVCITDISPERLKIAKDAGVECPVNVKDMKPADAAKKINDSLGEQPDMVIECCGFTSSIHTAIKSVKNGGKVIMVALGEDAVPIPILDVVAKEVKLDGVFGYTNTWPLAIDLVTTGKINLKKVTTAIYELENIQDAFVKSAKGEVIKVLVRCNKS